VRRHKATLVAAEVLAESGVAELTDMTVELCLSSRRHSGESLAIRVSRPSPSPKCGSWTDQRPMGARRGGTADRVSTGWCPVAKCFGIRWGRIGPGGVDGVLVTFERARP
jgi:hypothetical protein